MFLFHLFLSQAYKTLGEAAFPDAKTVVQTENTDFFLTLKVFQKHFQVENTVPAQ